ncbi:MAG TPA: hypothetical protein QF730_08735 [Planctomycetota bacterium]|jgi:hypothetical protein|nr:hypothetical protein [Planctomycetota bacterium]
MRIDDDDALDAVFTGQSWSGLGLNIRTKRSLQGGGWSRLPAGNCTWNPNPWPVA